MAAYSPNNEARLDKPYRTAILDMGQEVYVFCVKDTIPFDSLQQFIHGKSMTVLKNYFKPGQIQSIKDGLLGFNQLDITNLFKLAKEECNIDPADWKTVDTLAYYLGQIKEERNHVSHETTILTRDKVVSKIGELKLLYRNAILKVGERRCAQGGTMTSYEQYADAIVKRLEALQPEITVADLAVQMEIQIGHLSSKIEKIPIGTGQKTFQRAAYLTNQMKVVSKKKVFVINNIEFDADWKRTGAEMDSSNLRSTFELLGYDVRIHESLAFGATDHLLDRIQQDTSLDFLLLIILSHGIMGSGNSFMTRDNQCYNLKKVQERFTDDACPHLKDKAKVILCGYGRSLSGNDEIMAPYIISTRSQKQISNKMPRHMITIHCSREGYKPFRYINSGTYFVHFLCEILKEWQNLSIIDAFNFLEEKMREKLCKPPMAQGDLYMQLPEMNILSPIPSFNF